MVKKAKLIPRDLEQLKYWIRSWVDLTNVDVSGLDSLEWAFHDVKEYKGSIKDWDTKNVKDLSFCFCWAENFNEDISKLRMLKIYLSVFAELKISMKISLSGTLAKLKEWNAYLHEQKVSINPLIIGTQKMLKICLFVFMKQKASINHSINGIQKMFKIWHKCFLKQIHLIKISMIGILEM